MSHQSQSNNFKAALLADGFAGDLVIPGDPQYAASLTRFAKNARRNAALVAFVKSAEDVSKVINFVNTQSSATGTPIHTVIHGGGHSPSGTSSSEGGIVIDLSRYVNTVRVDEEKKLGYVGGGATWGAVDKETIKFGLAAPGGTVSHTGVGGSTLGGGLGWLMGVAGMTIDNLVEATIVVASGSILTANSTSHPDLYWAIRGGGCNFGCVTEFVLQLYPQRSHVFAGPLAFLPPLLPAVITALQEWYATSSENEGAAMAMNSKGPTGTPMVGVLIFYNGDEEEGRRRFAKLFDLGPEMNGARVVPYGLVNTLQNESMPIGVNYSLSGSTRGKKPVEPQAAQAMFDRIVQIASAPGACAVNGNPGIMVAWEFFHLKKAASVPVDATAFRMREEVPSVPILITWDGDSAEATKDAEERLRQVKQVADETFKDSFVGGKSENVTGYSNYEERDPQSTESAKAVFGGNYPRLQDVKARYDPGVFFRSWYPIQPSK